ncbi:MAG TPA: dihydrolipoyl dehydrogenase [Acidimicrobiales bacterium]|nr:dihydrolipoyl dehydrogenase [Acidimicrobiales bacterium]
MANEEEFDIVVIGGGPGGYATALYGAAAGLSVAIVERDKVGGTCLHRGCIPAKEFLETAAVRRTIEGSKEFGIDVSGVALDFARSQERKQAVVDKLWKGLQGLLKGRKVTTLIGTGTLKEGRQVEVLDGPDAGRVITGRNVVLASGSVPHGLPGFEIDGRWVMSSDEFLDLEKLPASVAIIGGGVVGCEFASLLADLGSKVTILEALDAILPGCDEDIVRLIVRSFKKRGIDIVTGVMVESHTPSADGTVTTVKAAEQSWDVEAVVVSVGRRPRTEGLVADGVGVHIDQRGFVVTDEYQRTGVDGVWAVGDIVAGTPQLAHVGFAEAIVAVKCMLGEPAVPVDNGKVPWAIYCHPEVAFCGMTEAQAKDAGIDVVTKKDPFGGNSRAQIIGDTEGLVKIVAEKRPDGTAGRILGVHMCGPWVTEQLSGGYLAVNWEAFPDEVAQFIQPHPSLSETFGETMLALTGRGLHLG